MLSIATNQNPSKLSNNINDSIENNKHDILFHVKNDKYLLYKIALIGYLLKNTLYVLLILIILFNFKLFNLNNAVTLIDEIIIGILEHCNILKLFINSISSIILNFIGSEIIEKYFINSNTLIKLILVSMIIFFLIFVIKSTIKLLYFIVFLLILNLIYNFFKKEL